MELPLWNCWHMLLQFLAVSCVEDAVRLNDEVVQVCYNQQWGFICHHTTSWRSKAANVVCNEAGIVSLS